MKTSAILITKPSPGYELIDSGEGEKLERFGDFILSRPDPQALWHKILPASEWKKAHGHFTREEKKGDWTLDKDLPPRWSIDLAGLKFLIKPTAFKHTGIFPEQMPNWEWMGEKIKNEIENSKNTLQGVSNSPAEPVDGGVSSTFANSKTKRKPAQSKGDGVSCVNDIEVLNLFGYTGGASLACAKAGAKVVHIDSSKAAVGWARDNAEASGLKDAPIRWIIEDARVFVEREIKRGRKYDAIVMDPPAFGHGPTSELWKIEEHFLALITDCIQLLKDKPLFFIINGYSAGYSAIAYQNNLNILVEKFGGSIEIGELTIEEKGSGRLLPSGIFARWSK